MAVDPLELGREVGRAVLRPEDCAQTVAGSTGLAVDLECPQVVVAGLLELAVRVPEVPLEGHVHVSRHIGQVIGEFHCRTSLREDEPLAVPEDMEVLLEGVPAPLGELGVGPRLLDPAVGRDDVLGVIRWRSS
jgi:hypothetical protein